MKVSQIEKQLELKEAATRRKIQALKHQLQGSRNVIQSPPVPTPSGLQPNTMYHSSHVDRLVLEPSHTSANPDNGHTQLHSQQRVLRPSQSQQLSKPPATAPGTVQQVHCNKHSLVEIPRSEIGHMTGSVNENRHIHDQHLNKQHRLHVSSRVSYMNLKSHHLLKPSSLDHNSLWLVLC